MVLLLTTTLCLLGQTATTPALDQRAETQPAPTSEARSALDRGVQLLDDNEIDAAIQTLQGNDGALILEDVVRRDEHLGVALAYAGRTAESQQIFEHLLAVSPGHVLPYTISPKATFVFEKAREEMSRVRATEVRLELPPAIAFDEPIEVTLVCTTNARDLVARWQLCHRLKSGREPYSCSGLTDPGVGRSTSLLPAVPDSAGEESRQDEVPGAILQLAVAGFDAEGNEVYRGPTRRRPLELPVGTEVSGPWYTNFWLWGAVGALTVATSVVAISAAVLMQPDTAQIRVEVIE